MCVATLKEFTQTLLTNLRWVTSYLSVVVWFRLGLFLKVAVGRLMMATLINEAHFQGCGNTLWFLQTGSKGTLNFDLPVPV